MKVFNKFLIAFLKSSKNLPAIENMSWLQKVRWNNFEDKEVKFFKGKIGVFQTKPVDSKGIDSSLKDFKAFSVL